MKKPRFPSISLQARLIVVMALMLLLIIAGTVSSQYLVHSMNHSLQQIVHATIKDIRPISELQKLVLKIEEPVHHYLIYGDPEEHETFAQMSHQIEVLFSNIVAHASSREEEEELLYQARRTWQQVRTSGEAVLMLDPQTAKAAFAEMKQFHQNEELLYNLLDRLYNLALEKAFEQEREALDTAENTLHLAISLAVAGAVIAILSTIVLLYSVLPPIKLLKQGAEHFGKGDLSHRISLTTRDELGELATAFNAMAQQLEKDQALLEEMAIHDGLTGLYNHREFQRLLQAEMERSQRYQRPLSLLMIDIDHFKVFNDSYGHQAGDEVLRALAAQMRREVRTVDYACRYGGEEFAIVLPEMAPSNAMAAAERLRKSVAALTIAVKEGQTVTITISIGVATFPEDADSKDKLIAAADRGLYAAKAAGRNRVLRAI